MRQIWKFPLDFANGEPVTVDMPEGAEVLRLAMQGPAHGRARLTPTIWALVDSDNPTEQRRFAVYGTGHDLPRQARYLGTWDAAPFVWHVFEMVGEPLPDGLDLPADAEAAYRTLTGAGFVSVDRSESPGLDTTGKAWLAPDDEPLTTEQMMAVATLQEHGFGPVVSK